MNRNVLLMTLHSQSNYGQQLQNFALSEKIKEFGYSPCTLRWDFNYFSKNKLGQDKNISNFVDKYIFSSNVVFSKRELVALVKSCSCVIIGGDQVFRNWWPKIIYQPVFRFYGDFVFGNIGLASYAASFGLDKFNNSEYVIRECGKLLSRFDRISVREKSGVEILNKTFGLNGIEVLDPVFFLSHEKYEEIINRADRVKQNNNDYIAYMFLNSSKVDDVLSGNLKDYNILNINFNESGEYNTVEQWLYNIKHSKFVITNSFHCVAIAIIFKKPFIVISAMNSGDSRIDNILSNFNLSQCRRPSIREVRSSDIKTQIDWDYVYKILNERCIKSENYLKEVLSLKPHYKKAYRNWPLSGIRARYEKAYRYRKKYQEAIEYKFGFRQRLLRIIIKFLVDSKRYKKLKSDHVLFFQDSKSFIIQFLGRFYN